MMVNFDNSESTLAALKASSVIEELNSRNRNRFSGQFNKKPMVPILSPTSQLIDSSLDHDKNGGSQSNPSSSSRSSSPSSTSSPTTGFYYYSQNSNSTENSTLQARKRSHDDRWILIQKNTFTNWINEQLKSDTDKVFDLKQDLSNGVVLIKLVNHLQRPKSLLPRKYYKTPQNQHQCLENISFALNAITDDGVKMVNIGNLDLYNGNLKLILGLVWHLILRYQIGKTKVPPKKLILAWLNAVLMPELRLTNLTSDLNNGLALAGLVNYCEPFLFTDWSSWDRNERLENCKKAMNAALLQFDIPLIVSPENMSSPELDELSSITYLSYYIKDGSPGYRATLKWVQSQLPDDSVSNFSKDWSDGYLLCKLAVKLGAMVPDFSSLNRAEREQNCQRALLALQHQLSIELYITAKEMAELESTETSSIGLMATLIQLRYAKRPEKPIILQKPTTPPIDKLNIDLIDSSGEGLINKPFEFKIEYGNLDPKLIKSHAKGPKTKPFINAEFVKNGLLSCNFVPTEAGQFELYVLYNGHLIENFPFKLNVKQVEAEIVPSEKTTFVFQPLDMQVILGRDADVDKLLITSKSSSTNQEILSHVEEREGKLYAKIVPTEPGEWITRAFYDNQELKGSPFPFQVFDFNLAEITGLHSDNSTYQINNKISFQVDVSKIGKGNFSVNLINLKTGKQYPVDVSEKEIKKGVYDVSFTPNEPGVYKCMVLYKNKPLKKSPIDFNVGVDTSQVIVDFSSCKSVLVNQTCSFTVDVRQVVVDPNNNKDTVNGVQRDVKAIITSPSGNHIVPKIINQEQMYASWLVEYVANEIGEYYVDVFYANQLVPGSPWKSNVFDPTKIKLAPTLHGIVDQIVRFEVDASKAGTGQLEIAVDNGRIPCNFTSSGNLKFIPSFTPRDAGKHEVSVKFNNFEVPDSPFICNVIDLNRITVTSYTESTSPGSLPAAPGPLLFPIYKTNLIEISLDEIFAHNLQAKLIAPSGILLPLSRSTTHTATIKLGFLANEIGTHRLELDYAGVALMGSPFDVKIYDSNRIVVSEPNRAEVNKSCEFSIDASSAGEGQLEIAVNDGLVKNNVRQIKPGHYLVSFVPVKSELYVIEVKFNNEMAPGCPKKFVVKDAYMARLARPVIESIIVNEEAQIHLTDVQNLADLHVQIKAPETSSSPNIVPKIHPTSATITSSLSGDFTVKWIPRELGTYLVNITYGDHPVKDTPLRMKVYDPKQVRVINMSEFGVVKMSSSFVVDASEAGEGSLEIGITCSGQFIPNQVKPLGHSKFEVQFVPEQAAVHLANINFNGQPVLGSPFQIRVIDSTQVKAHGKGLGAIPINLPTTFHIMVSSFAQHHSSQQNLVRAVVTGPGGQDVPVKLVYQPNGDCVGEFTPVNVGQHRVEIFYAQQPVSGSPFLAQAYDPNSCEIKSMPKELVLGVENGFEIDTARVGQGVELVAKIVSPAGVMLPVQYSVVESVAGRKKVTFVPSELGPHKITVQLAGHNLAGTPVLVHAVEPRFPTVRGEGLHHAIEDKPAYFFIDPQGMKGSLEVNIEGPQHYTKNQIERQPDGAYLVKYTPVECGLFKIFVRWNQRDVPASPFLAYVINPEKVRVVGGWQSVLDQNSMLSLKLYEEKSISFDTSEAGPGHLTAVINAPNGSKLPFKLTNTQPHIHTLVFTALYEGEYKIHLFFENHSIASNMPIVGKTVSSVPDMNRVEVHGVGLHDAKIGQEYEFVIDGSRAGPDLAGLPEIKMVGTRCDIETRLTQIGHNIYKCSYIPQIPGAYLLSIKWGADGRQVGESPYKVNVGMTTDPAKVVVSGEGIKSGVYGQEIKAIIDTRRAGPGELTAHCMGPLKVAYCEFFDHKDGTFTLFVKPQEPGKHLLQIKYNDEHVPGSPFVLRVAGPPDASKVKVFGPGICHGVLNKYESRFVCETKGAGAGQLTVRIRGPKGAFRVEMQRESQKDRTIYCKFDPTEPGHYQINVKWSGVHVPGSPFNVNVFSSQEELEHFLKTNPEAAYSIQQNSNMNQHV